jgi:integrating conjugative element protein (TIGR03756 family)
MLKALFICSTLLVALPTLAKESTKPPEPITSPGIAAAVFKKLDKNSHLKEIGACVWLKKGRPPKIIPGLALSQFLPDLVVTVSNNPGENPWVEANVAYENKPALSVYQSVFKAALGSPLGFGDGSGQQAAQHMNEDRTRVVSVIGSPANLYRIKGITHTPETTFSKLYYSSLSDAVNERMQVGEIIYLLTHPNLLIGHEIGTNSNFWGHEMPRLMRVTQPSRFRASVVAAMHAVDIVTNEGMHVKQATSNACGPNCAVANVIFDPKQKGVIWQEVYPLNRNIIPGDPKDFGVADDRKGNGNYVFVVWRKYRGCVKQKAKYLKGVPHVNKTKKR